MEGKYVLFLVLIVAVALFLAKSKINIASTLTSNHTATQPTQSPTIDYTVE